MTHSTQGYTLVEMLVAMAVTSIVLSGTYAAYTFFAQQQQSLLAQTEVDRGALRTIDLMQSDIRMAGFKDYFGLNPMSAGQAIVLESLTPGDVRLVYDDYDNSGTLYRALVRYHLATFTSPAGLTRNRLLRERRMCNDPSQFCDLSNSKPLTGPSTGNGEPVLDWVSNFSLKDMNQRATGSFAGQYQTIQVNLVVDSPKKIEGTARKVSKSFTFLARAKNVSMVP